MELKIAASLMAILMLTAFSAAAMDEDIFNTSKETGMTPGVPPKDSGVRTPLAGSEALANAAGTWSMTLTDASPKELKLTLYQNDDAVFGYGEMTVAGNSTPVSAGGSLAGNDLSLFVIPGGDPSLYMMSLVISANSMNGDYVHSTAAGSKHPGVAFGKLIQAGDVNPSTAVLSRSTSLTAQPGENQGSSMPKGPKGSGV